MARVVDGLSILLLLAACAAFFLGFRAVVERDDLRALYLAVVGGLSLKASVELLRPRGA